ncbi:Uncharacterised protein [Klebsiella pneumoniae]|nr:Uncharacterised protein [Klebsiella pneumoniae]
MVMVSHVRPTIRSTLSRFDCIAAFIPCSWALMASLILFALAFSSDLTTFSCLLNAAFSLSSVSCCCAFDFSSKSLEAVKRLLINGSPQSDISPPVRVGNADTVFCGSDHLKTGRCERPCDVITRFQLS